MSCSFCSNCSCCSSCSCCTAAVAAVAAVTAVADVAAVAAGAAVAAVAAGTALVLVDKLQAGNELSSVISMISIHDSNTLFGVWIRACSINTLCDSTV